MKSGGQSAPRNIFTACTLRHQTEDETLPGEKFAKEISGMFWIFLAVFLFISMYSFHPGDPTLNQAVSPGWKVRNLIGPAGSYTAGLLVDLLGMGSWVIPFYVLFLGVTSFFTSLKQPWWRWLGLGLLYVCVLAWASHPWLAQYQKALAIHAGGFVGAILSKWSFKYLKPVGAFLFWLFATLAGIQLTANLSWAAIGKKLRSIFIDCWCKNRERIERKSKRMQAERAIKKAEKRKAKASRKAEVEEEKGSEIAEEDETVILLKPFEEGPAKKEKPAQKPKPKAKKIDTSTDFPPLDMLAEPSVAGIQFDPKVLEVKTESLKACLNDFNIEGEIQQVTPGPVVTMFEFRPAPGIKVSKIANLTDDIAMALKAVSVRIEAPIPGKDTVGIEIPNDKRQIVYLREIFEHSCFTESKSVLTMALGKDIQGVPVSADLAKMPHLLVAGATGAGKSVCLNGLLMSMLYKAGPEELKLLLIDPKRIELAVYASLPHLVHPVVTDMSLAKSALEWAVYEMDKRYDNMARLGARNIASYNTKLAKMDGSLPEDLEDLEPMPFLVIIVDELADLMLTAGKDVEQSIVRLAQLARAAGIHLIIATQRPSVDVVTGLIKANFPTRISFQVTSKHDSRTILDTIGSEKLLGRGDMLFKPSGGQLRRLHGALVEDEEIKEVVNFWKTKYPQDFELDFTDWKDSSSSSGGGSDFSGDSEDSVYNEAVQFVMEQGKASISLLQRRFRIGFNRAARYIEQMEQDGILGPQDGSKPRIVLVTRD
ncbi:DNA translocase FtsK 4TM domain-containing protein [Maridesulfovibrio sp.]|uniref:DNA translocase FtsK n=1 Tax=Maridesulfovibrio sp. TaxID=2795000 RepID=UPI002A18A25D|nr:DNA translocase FtsK 4TM domain-containing protein [Maridesulfovibrio sp.]